MKQQDDDYYRIISEIYLYVKDPFEAKYQNLIKKTWKKMILKIKMIQRLLLKIQIITKMSIKRLGITTQAENAM